mmetsp:Transcript_12973/g.20800  ORF Transcript_12973/g.20800 Transcript_12973/m.20800 type:complete len:384 (-) Transcript_12973:193-1344(-)|eukprot:jgi/Bigna1/33227/e_gw1.1.92.1
MWAGQAAKSLFGHLRRRGHVLLQSRALVAAPVGAFALGAALWQSWSPSNAEPHYPEERRTVQLFKDARNSVVSITNLSKVPNSFFSDDVKVEAIGVGSGFVWDSSGHVITNHHVVENSVGVRIMLPDGEQCLGKVVGVDEATDLAVIQIPESCCNKVKPIKFDENQTVEVGQSTYAIGYPFGLDQTLTAGLVSGVGRQMPGKPLIFDVIQTDAAVNPGSSGGPLVDSKGQLIGVNAAMLTTNGGSFSGVGYAIPHQQVKKVVESLIKHGRVIRPALGITIAPERVLAHFGEKGVLVFEVIHGKAAWRAGLNPTFKLRGGEVRVGDAIVAIDGRKIESSKDLFMTLDDLNVGDNITVGLKSFDHASGKFKHSRNVKITLQAKEQ